MPRNEQQLDGFDALMRELEQEANRPFAPRMPGDEKQALRQDLLSQYEQPSLSRRAVLNLWRFAGAAAGLVLLGLAVLSVWMALGGQNPATTGAPVPTATVAATAETAVVTVAAQPLEDAPVFGDAVQLVGYELTESGHSEGFGKGWTDGDKFTISLANVEYLAIDLSLQWHFLNTPTADYNMFLHLVDANGTMIAQQDGSIAETTLTRLMILPADVAAGTYDLLIGLYDPTTQQRLPLPNGETALTLTTLALETEDAAEASDRVWIESMIQQERPSADATVAITVTVGYELASAAEGVLKLHYAAPDWMEAGANGRLPIDGMSQLEPITVDEDSITITFRGNPNEMAQIVGTETPVLMVQMGELVPHEDGNVQFVLFVTETFSDVALDLTSTGQIVWRQEKPQPPASCPVTQPAGPAFAPPEPFPSDSPYDDQFWYGSDALWTMLLKDGVWWDLPRGEDGYGQKVFWWSNAFDANSERNPALTVSGERLDGDETFTVADATHGFHSDLGEFMLAGVSIPSPGCWQITGQYRENELSFVVWVAP